MEGNWPVGGAMAIPFPARRCMYGGARAVTRRTRFLNPLSWPRQALGSISATFPKVGSSWSKINFRVTLQINAYVGVLFAFVSYTSSLQKP